MIVCTELDFLSDVNFHESLLNIFRESQEKLGLVQNLKLTSRKSGNAHSLEPTTTRRVDILNK